MQDNGTSRPHPPTPSNSPGETPRKRPSVLIIDDDQDMLDALHVYLEGNGFEVKAVSRGVQGVRLVMERDFDAILCDMVMPRMPGDMFYLAVSKVKPHLCKRFVFITGYGSEPAIAAFLAATQQPVLHKPTGMNRLLDVVSAVARGASTPVPAKVRHLGPASSGRFALVR